MSSTTDVRPLVSDRSGDGAGVVARRTAVWPPIAAWSTGLIVLALGAGAVTTTEGGGRIRAAGVILLLLGSVALAWGTVALIRGRIVVPRIGVAGALSGLLVLTGAFALAPERIGILAVAPASVMLLLVGVACAREVRRGAGASRIGQERGRARVAEIVVVGVLAAALTTPALAAVEAGYLAPVDGTVVVPDTGHRH